MIMERRPGLLLGPSSEQRTLARRGTRSEAAAAAARGRPHLAGAGRGPPAGLRGGEQGRVRFYLVSGFRSFAAQGEPFCDRVLSSGSMAFSKTSKAVAEGGGWGAVAGEAGPSQRSALPCWAGTRVTLSLGRPGLGGAGSPTAIGAARQLRQKWGFLGADGASDLGSCGQPWGLPVVFGQLPPAFTDCGSASCGALPCPRARGKGTLRYFVCVWPEEDFLRGDLVFFQVILCYNLFRFTPFKRFRSSFDASL